MKNESIPEPSEAAAPAKHFIRQIIEDDLRAGKNGGRVVTRFPPEPNGYLHIGHAKAICIDFGMALEHGGECHLRMDDTNPTKEEVEYIESIQEDVRWLGFDWGKHFYFASDYFGRMFDCCAELIRKGKAYVCGLTQDEWSKTYRGAPPAAGQPSPYRDRPAEESLRLFEEMRAGKHADGALCVRAKIDMASPNLHLRDPVLYRILHAGHPHTGNTWCVYPTYDFAHPLEDAFEGITHSLCTLEFEVHRPLYDWVIDNLDNLPSRPRQYEFARLNLTYTVMSKRRLLELVNEGRVRGWDDPRMPTIGGLRRRGYTPEAIRAFVEAVGVTKFESLSDVALLEHCVRDDLNKRAARRLAVLNPRRVVIENASEIPAEVDAVNNPEDKSAGTRKVPFSSELFVEADDFMENPPPKYFRLTPGGSVRIRYAGFLTCLRVEGDAVVCRWSPPEAALKVKGTIHWVSAKHAVPAEVRLYDRLFSVEDPMAKAAAEGKDYHEFLNPDSLKTATGFVEPGLAAANPLERFQFERLGYFCVDPDSKAGRLVFNRAVTLKDTWAKVAAKA
ncbi:MAG TPA: glutamine--tRNA ligase/YqeY domain fusion protein [Kiritimatiellia bacterium]|nr:glutamine--tRNA ligase/YqeY domain fusion protein [Kiritimatiellia bacterium]HRZ11318.1 glutamine--tRNA ligase/YqeY domain fusion protein [Kiritimatiellia bacterium]HSA17131.1 glutamine--tRNA ligase/YqeY domain fusion protein [Kiritimatiellia bacterium]